MQNSGNENGTIKEKDGQDFMFSNSLIIHNEKTEEITTVTMVWRPDLN